MVAFKEAQENLYESVIDFHGDLHRLQQDMQIEHGISKHSSGNAIFKYVGLANAHWQKKKAPDSGYYYEVSAKSICIELLYSLLILNVNDC